MKIKIESAQAPHDIEHLIKAYPCLTDFGFAVDKKVSPVNVTVKNSRGEDCNFEVHGTTVYTPYIQIDSMEDMLRLGKTIKRNLLFTDEVVSFDGEFSAAIRIIDRYTG